MLDTELFSNALTPKMKKNEKTTNKTFLPFFNNKFIVTPPISIL